ncbi:hypothetical protein D0Z07_8169 [Hyphodiscus hymeniophilus]|uniref:Bromo domain-containing protein n=1 Tax=Hyphodiscus hymeniophilus TaxID=353542 RepID=A0A9P6SKY5_9HELO|nr:hypothetical protein D0Z07_8169 [Hyphodiscus hymeniophilus]
MIDFKLRSELPGDASFTPRQNIVVAPLHLVSSHAPLDSWRGFRGMTPAAGTYTPLESLLLFQSLATHGTDEKSFARISELLTSNVFVKDGDTYDPERLRSDSLRELFLLLMRDELRAEEDGLEIGGQPTSNKRKVPSPALPTIKDAEDHKDKLPILVDRLYARYRSSMVEAIREDERRYHILQQEVEEIERGEWDERILKENTASTNRNGSVSPKKPRAKVNGTSPLSDALEVSKSQVSKEQSAKPQSMILLSQKETRHEGLGINDMLNSRESTRPSSPQVHDPKSMPGTQIAPPNQQRPSSNGPHTPSSLQPLPHQQPPLLQQQINLQQQPGMAFKWEPPYGPPHHSQAYPQSGPYPPHFNSQQYPPQSYSQPPRGSFPSPHGLQHPHLPSSPLSLQHPHQSILPPPNGGHRAPGSPHGVPLDALADAAGQQYRATSGSPMMQPPPMHGSPMQPSSGFASPYPVQQRPLPGNAPPQWVPHYQGSPHQGPPVPSQQYSYQPPPNQRPYPPQPSLIPPENRQYTSPYNANQGSRLSIGHNIQKTRPSLPGTPVTQGPPRHVTGHGTRWTPNPTGSTPKTFTPSDHPIVEPISPIQRPANLPLAKKFVKNHATNSEPRLRKSASKRGAQRTRAGSTASSVIAGSHRSQSVASHADELSLDNDVKEEVATPLPLPPGLEDETGDTTADESLPNIRSRPSRTTTSPSLLKRKRNDSIAETPRTPGESVGPASHVLWTRAFPKISASALESVTSHRHASMFAVPVKERDAPGYKSLILQPQDLKSIKSAILAGNRAALAAVPDDTPQAQTNVWLPSSEDLIPPKGIINYAQLEKEFMRMFANAIMFNADPDRGLGASWEEMRGGGKKGGEGYEIDEDAVVNDTKAMYADVEQVIGSLRNAERKGDDTMGVSGVRLGSVVRGSSAGPRGSSVIGDGDDEPDELAGDGDVATGTYTKRRRKA